MAISISAISTEGIEVQCTLALVLALGLEGLLAPEKGQRFNFKLYSKLTPWNPYLDRMKGSQYRRAIRILGCVLIFMFFLMEFVVIVFPK
jgi:hypothetical protein